MDIPKLLDPAAAQRALELDRDADPGPWRCVPNEHPLPGSYAITDDHDEEAPIADEIENGANAELMAEGRMLMPQLARQVLALIDVVKALKKAAP